MTEVGSASFRINADTSGLNKGLNKIPSAAQGAGNALDKKLGGGFDKASKKASKFDNLLTGIFQGIGQELTQLAKKAAIAPFAGITGSLGAFRELDAELQQFSAISGLTRDEMGALEGQIEALGLATTKSPTEIAQTANALQTLGASAGEVVEQLPGVTALSEATASSLELSGQVVQTVQNVFGEASDDIADKLTVLRNNTAASVEDVLQLASKAGAVGAPLGENFNTLAAAFATLRDSGFGAERASTGLQTALLRLSAPSASQAKAFEDLGVEAFDAADKFKGLDVLLPEIAAAVENLSDKRRGDLLGRAFGSEALPAVNALLGELDGKLVETRTKLDDFEGSAAKSAETLTQGFSGSIDLLQGSVATLRELRFGDALSPAGTAATLAIKDVVDEVINTDGLFDDLTTSAEGFAKTLEDNPDNIKQISRAVVDVVAIINEQIANALDALSDFFSDSSSVDGFANAIAGIGAAIEGAGTILTSLAPIIQLAAKNSDLLAFALKVVLTRMIAIKAVGFAQSLVAMGTQAVAAAGGLTAMAGAAAAALVPLLAIGAAIAALEFRKLARFNEEIDLINKANSVVADESFANANRINNLNDRILKARREGVSVSEDDLKLAEQLRGQAEAQLAALQERIRETRDAKPVGEAQRNAQQNELNSLEISERALQAQLDELDTNLSAGVDVDPGSVDDVSVEVDAAVSEEAEETLFEAFQKTSDEALQRVQQNANARVQAVREAQLAGVQGEEEAAAAIAAIQQETLQEELAAKRSQLAELQGLAGEDEKETEAIAQQRLALETEISGLAVGVVEAEIAEKERLRQKEIDDLERANDRAEAALEQSQQRRIAAIREAQLAGLDDDEVAEQTRQAEQAETAERIALKQQELNQISALEAQGLIDAEEAADRRIELNTEIGQLRIQQLDQELAAQKAAEQAAEEAALERIENTLKAESEALALSTLQGRGQLDLLGAQIGLQEALNAVANTRLETEIQQAAAAGEIAQTDKLRSQLAKQQSAQFERQAIAQQEQLQLQQQIRAVELERARLEAQIALAEAEATDESEQVLSLRRQQVALANDAIARQEQINQAQRDTLSAQQDVSREQERQARLSEEQNRRERERARLLGIISGSLNETDQERASGALANAEERFDLARGAGLVGRGDQREFNAALRDVERLVDREADDEALLSAAIEQRDNDIFQQLLRDIGRGDIAELAALEPVSGVSGAGGAVRPTGLREDAIARQFEQVQAGQGAPGLGAVGQQIVSQLESIKGLLGQALARPYSLNVATVEDPGLVAAGVYAEQQKAGLQALGA